MLVTYLKNYSNILGNNFYNQFHESVTTNKGVNSVIT